MKTVEELTKEAQEEILQEKEQKAKKRLKELLLNVANAQENLAFHQKKLAEFEF